MWNRSDDDPAQPQPRPRSGTEPSSGAGRATIGSSIAIQGKLAGKEDLLIEGRFEGELRVPGHQVTIGRQGSVEAEIQARLIVVEGKLSGNIVAEEQAVVRATGKVDGDIKAPKVALDEGCQFKGRIDMEPVEGKAGKPETKDSETKDSETKSADTTGTETGKSPGSGISATGQPQGKETGPPGSGSQSGPSSEGPDATEKSSSDRPGSPQEASRKRA